VFYYTEGKESNEISGLDNSLIIRESTSVSILIDGTLKTINISQTKKAIPFEFSHSTDGTGIHMVLNPRLPNPHSLGGIQYRKIFNYGTLQ